MINSLWSLQATLIALSLAVFITFATGIFMSSVRVQKYTDTHWYYINRGVPTAWSGVSNPGSQVDFPIVKAPFISVTAHGERFDKIIDLQVFLPVFAIATLVSYVIAQFYFRVISASPLGRKLVIELFLFCLGFAALMYFLLFPRV